MVVSPIKVVNVINHLGRYLVIVVGGKSPWPCLYLRHTLHYSVSNLWVPNWLNVLINLLVLDYISFGYLVVNTYNHVSYMMLTKASINTIKNINNIILCLYISLFCRMIFCINVEIVNQFIFIYIFSNVSILTLYI